MATQSLSVPGSTGGPSLGVLIWFWLQREEFGRGMALNVAWSVGSFSSWKKMTLHKIENKYTVAVRNLNSTK